MIRIRKISTNWLATLALLALFAAPACAQQTALTLDPAKTTVSFTLHDVLHTVHGTFRLKTGSLTFDRADGSVAGRVVVDATSGESGNGGRDGRMHREILESAKYPEISFVPVQVEGNLQPQGDSHVTIRGTLELHGEQHNVEIPADVHIAGAALAADLTFPLTYVKWGVKNPSTFVLRVSDTVEIEIHAAGQLAQPGSN